jgi:Creatinase/Prolidase N-terminal domain
MRNAVLTRVELPDFGKVGEDPVLSPAIYGARIERLLARMRAARLDALVIYGDREHVANIAWATGYDPRFEEALLVVVPGRRPALMLGNEGYPYAETANGDFDRVLWQPLSLMGQPRDQYRPLPQLLAEAGLAPGMATGIAGWKGFESDSGAFDPDWFETPHYLVESLRAFGPVVNAAEMFMHPESGLRVINEADQLAAFEAAATRTSRAVLGVIRSIRPGMSEYEALTAMQLDGFPQSTHVNFCSGPRAKYGLPSPNFRVMETGDPIAFGIGLMGALNCRCGFLAHSENDLPAEIRDYVPKLVAPYFEAVVAWYEAIGIGVEGGAVYDAVMSRIGDPFFGIGLNPGHLIHLDEWVHSPVKKGSRQRFASGMAVQCDIIPATGTPWFTTNIEDGIALADEALRAELAERHPAMWARVEARRAFMTDVIGIRLKPEVLPFSNMPAWLPPFWLGHDKVMAMR